MSLTPLIADADADLAVDSQQLAEAIEAFQTCAVACTACASACLAEEEVASLRDCIATDDVCAEVCTATARVLARLTKGSWEVLDAQLAALETATRACAQECAQHADHHEHCRRCQEACERAGEHAARLREALPR